MSSVITSIQNSLLFLLALYRFIIVFFPSWKSVASTNFKKLIKILYIFFILVQIIHKLLQNICIISSMIDENILLVPINDKRKNSLEYFEKLSAKCNECTKFYDHVFWVSMLRIKYVSSNKLGE